MGDETYARTAKIFTFGLFMMVITHALVHAAGNIRSTLFPVLKEEFRLTNQQIGLIVAIPTLCQTFFSIPTGFFSDRFGAKKLIALSIIMAAAGAFLGSISVNPMMYIVASTLLILNSTIYHPPSQSYITSITKPKDRSRALGIWNGGGTFGVSLGPLSVSVLMGVFALQWRQVYWFWVIPILFGLVALYFVKDSTDVLKRVTADEESEADSVKKLLNKNMVIFLLSSTVRRFGGSLTSGFLSIWLVTKQEWTLSNLGIMLGVSSAMGIFASPLGGELASRYGEKRWAVFTLFASYTCFLLAIVLKGFWPFMIFYLVQRFFGMLGMAANSALTARLSPPRQRGMGFALSSLPGSLVGSLGPIIAAYVVDLYGLYSIFIATAVIYYIGLGIFQFGVKVD